MEKTFYICLSNLITLELMLWRKSNKTIKGTAVLAIYFLHWIRTGWIRKNENYVDQVFCFLPTLLMLFLTVSSPIDSVLHFPSQPIQNHSYLILQYVKLKMLIFCLVSMLPDSFLPNLHIFSYLKYLAISNICPSMFFNIDSISLMGLYTLS